MADSEPTGETWISALNEVLDEGIERDETVELTAEDLRVDVPLRFGPDSERAEWHFDGSVSVSVDGETGPLAEWMQYWYRRRVEERRTARRHGRSSGDSEDDADPAGSASVD